jgi:butyrate kinase|tara:strand:- start:141 stop:380 length:240 start_codon:yes stop_codon:yes gene_type:complete
MKKKTVKEGVIASYSVLVNNKGELISEVSALPEDKADIMNETFKRSEEEKQFYIQLVKELKLKFNEVEKWIQKYITSIN